MITWARYHSGGPPYPLGVQRTRDKKTRGREKEVHATMLYSKQLPQPPEGWVEKASHMAPPHPDGISRGRRRNQ
eukprot:8210527-Pyramimonas_sp.AAC.1